jgi:hypothetical protein
MKQILTVLLLLTITTLGAIEAYIAYKTLTAEKKTRRETPPEDPTAQRLKITQNDSEIKIENQDNTTKYKKVESFKKSYRVFGYNKNPYQTQNSEINHIDSLLIATPLEKTLEILAQKNCEKTALDQSETLVIIAATKDIRDQLNNYSKNLKKAPQRVQLEGYKLKRINHQFEGKTLLSLTVTGGPGKPPQDNEALLITTLTPLK